MRSSLLIPSREARSKPLSVSQSVSGEVPDDFANLKKEETEINLTNSVFLLVEVSRVRVLSLLRHVCDFQWYGSVN